MGHLITKKIGNLLSLLTLVITLSFSSGAQAQYLDTISALGYSDDPTEDVFTGPDQFGCNFSGRFNAIKDSWAACVNAKSDLNTGAAPVDFSTYGFDNFRNLRPLPSYPGSIFVPAAPTDHYVSMLYAADLYHPVFNSTTLTWSRVHDGTSPNTGLTSTRSPDCPVGFNLAFDLCQRNIDWDPSKNDGDCPQSCGNPINQATGTKTQIEVDYQHAGFDLLQLVRYYTSSTRYHGLFGKKWRSNYDSSIGYYTSSTISTAVVRLASSKTLYFNQSGSNWITDSDVNYQLTQFTDNSGSTPVTYWRLLTPEDSVEIYDAVSGKLVSITKRDGYKVTLAYDTVQGISTQLVLNHLLSVTDSLGRQLQFAYNPAGYVSTITNPASQSYQYLYNTNGYLASVTYPDTKTRQYTYSTTIDGALTGIIDENSNTFATWAYDTQGRAYSSEHAGGAEKVTIQYNTTSSIVTDSLGAIRIYNFSNYLGMRKTDSVTGEYCSTARCGDSARTYDANGNIATRTDFNGHMTTYGYDLVRNLETSRTEGLNSSGSALPETRTIATTWHATWHLPTEIDEYAGATATGTPLKRTLYSYDTQGNLSQISINDPVASHTRTTTITNTYSSTVPGLILTKVIDGPRSDVSDITTLTYYSDTDTCVGCRGQLKTVTDSLTHVIQYTSYDANGQLLSMTDQNGLVTTNTYDARQRLKTNSVGTELTTVDYDNTGLATKLTWPDGSFLSYTYDAAHRLTNVTDSLGNSINYTLDTMGNHIQENIKDPQGNVTKSLARSYDVLNRLKTLTGVGQE